MFRQCIKYNSVQHWRCIPINPIISAVNNPDRISRVFLLVSWWNTICPFILRSLSVIQSLIVTDSQCGGQKDQNTLIRLECKASSTAALRGLCCLWAGVKVTHSHSHMFKWLMGLDLKGLCLCVCLDSWQFHWWAFGETFKSFLNLRTGNNSSFICLISDELH